MRKTIFTLGLMLAAALSLTNCTKNEEATFTPEVKVPFELYANMDDTRTTNNGMSTEWEANDEINVFHAVAGTTAYVNDTPYVDGAGTPFVTDGTGTFKGSLAEELKAGSSYDWYAFYPYSSYVKTPASTSSGYMPIGCKSNEYQTQNGNNSMAHIAGENYPLVGVVKGVAASDKPAITMSHVSSLVEFNVTNNCGDGVIIKSIELTAGEDIVGTYYINFAGENLVCTSSGDTYVSKTAKLTVGNGEAIDEGGSAKFYMGIKPFTAKNTDNLTITITTNQGVYSLSKKFATTFHPGKIKTINVNMDELVGDEPSEPGEIKTISEILAAGNGAALSGTIEGVVVSNLELNNLTSKKGMYVQDATGALQFYLAANHEFAFGTKVSINLAGTTLGAYNGAVQISGLALDKITTVSTGNTVEPKTVSIADFLANKYEGQYVAIEGVQVAASDLSKTWVSGGAHTSINVEDAAGNKFVVFSAKYATYGTQTVAQGSGTIKGISSINNDTMQIIFAQESDFAGLTGERFGDPVTPDPEPELPTEGETVTFKFDQKSGSGNSIITRHEGVITCVVAKGTSANAPNEHDNGHLRFMGGNTMTISGATITNVVFEFASGYVKRLSANVGDIQRGETSSTWTGSAQEVVFKNEETAQARILSVKVTYTANPDSVEKTEQNLSFTNSSVNVNLDDTYTGQQVNNAMTTVEYSSSDENVATVNPKTGEVTLVGAGNTIIKAIAVETEEFYRGEASYTLTVNPASVVEGGVTTITMETFSAISAAMDDVISYTTAKGLGTSAPAVNDGEIRLYQNGSGTGGGYITITAKEGYTLSSVTIGSSMKTKVAYIIGNSDTETKSKTEDLAANGKYTVSDIGAQSISIYCMGADKNSRLYVNYLSVSYKAAE